MYIFLGCRNSLDIKNKVRRMHTVLLDCEHTCAKQKYQYRNRKKKGKFTLLQSLPSHLLASSALFRSLSGRASSQSSIVLISFPLIE